MDDILTGISDLFLGNGIVIIIACMIVGLFLKGTFKKLPNKYIPFCNAGVAIILGFVIPDTYSDKDIVSKIILLIFLGLASTGLYEALCVILKDRYSIDVKKIVSKFRGDNDEDKHDGDHTPEDEPHDEIPESQKQPDPGK